MKLLEVSQSLMAVLRAIKFSDSYLSTYLNIQVVSVNKLIEILRMQLLIESRLGLKFESSDITLVKLVIN